jgi:hypothetical protein
MCHEKQILHLIFLRGGLGGNECHGALAPEMPAHAAAYDLAKY